MPERKPNGLERTAQGYIGFGCYVGTKPDSGKEPFVVVARTADIATELAEKLAPTADLLASRCEKILITKAPK